METPASFPSIEDIDMDFNELMPTTTAVGEGNHSGEETANMGQEHWTKTNAFARRMHSIYNRMHPAYLRTWNELQAAQKEISELKARLQPLQHASPEKFESVQAANGDLSTQLLDTRQRLESNQKEFEAKEFALNQVSLGQEQELEEVMTEMRQLEEAKKEQESRMQTMRRQMEEMKKEQESRMQTISQELAKQRRQNDTHKHAKSSLDRTHQKVQDELKEAQQRLAQVEIANETLRDSIAYYTEHSHELQRTCVDHLDELHERRSAATDSQDRPFVVVFLDADGYVFSPELLRRGESGGWAAADQLLEAVQAFVSSSDSILKNAEVVVRANASLKNLAYFLVKDQATTINDVYAFFAGFNARQPLFGFEDVGPGKERADEKIKENFRFFAAMPQCQHLILCCGHDAGYASFLHKYASQSSQKRRITLMEHVNMRMELSELGFGSLKAPDGLFDEGASGLKIRR